MLRALALAWTLAQGPTMPSPFQDANNTTPQEAIGDASDFTEGPGASYGMFVLLATLAVIAAMLLAQYTRRRHP